MILASVPQVIFTAKEVGRTLIGEPEDYTKNKENNRFPQNIDISIPGQDEISIDDIGDLASELDEKARVSKQKDSRQEESKTEIKSPNLPRNSRPYEESKR